MRRSYIMPNGRRVAVGVVGAGWTWISATPWGTCIYEQGKCKPLRRKALPPRATLDEAQADLDAYAAKAGWEETR